MPEADRLRVAIEQEFGADRVRVVVPRHAGVSEVDVNVTPGDDSPFTVSRFRNGSVSADGTPRQNAVIASLVRSLLPPVTARVVAVIPDGNVFVDLTPGIMPADVEAGWRDISRGGF